ncbi:MAG: hypothetical protein U1E14_08330 [Geminicoccaceae bacterium]
MKPIADRAEVTIDLPDKLYMGSFTRHSNYGVSADGEQLGLRLAHAEGPRRTVEFHLHYYLLADVLKDLAAALAARPALDEPHREALEEAARELLQVVSARQP